MKKLFAVLMNLLSFGIPLFIRMLTKAKKFQKIVDGQLFVTLNFNERKKVVNITDSKTGNHLLTLEVDIDLTKPNNDYI
jgi:hypothetical protein